MRQLLRYLGTRSGLSLGLIVMVVVVLVAARLLPHHTDSTVTVSVAPSVGVGVQPPEPSTSQSPSPQLLHSPEPPLVASGVRTPQTVAHAFALAWLSTAGVAAADWRTSLTPYSTKSLINDLADADPANVPANKITADVTTVDDTPDQCVVDVPMDSGTLALTMTVTKKHKWLVNAVDWNRS